MKHRSTFVMFALVAWLMPSTSGFACSCSDTPAHYVSLFHGYAAPQRVYFSGGRPKIEEFQDPVARLATAENVALGKDVGEVAVPGSSWFLRLEEHEPKECEENGRQLQDVSNAVLVTAKDSDYWTCP